MEQKNKSILAVAIAILVILAFIIVAVIMNNKKKPVISPKTNSETTAETKTTESDVVIPLTEEKKAEIAAIRNIKGKITKIDISAIEVTPTEGDKLTLKIPQKGANFVSLTKREDGALVAKEIGLLEVPKDKEVSIQYNSTTNEVMLVEVR